MFELADRVSVLRDGALVGTRDIGETNEADLIALMINRSIEQIYHKEKVPIGATILETREPLRARAFDDVSITVRAGEIVGLYGLIGAGRSEFVQSVFGRHPQTAGADSLAGRAGRHPQRAAGDRARHRAGAGEPARPGPVPQPGGRPQHQPADLRPADARAR